MYDGHRRSSEHMLRLLGVSRLLGLSRCFMHAGHRVVLCECAVSQVAAVRPPHRDGSATAPYATLTATTQSRVRHCPLRHSHSHPSQPSHSQPPLTATPHSPASHSRHSQPPLKAAPHSRPSQPSHSRPPTHSRPLTAAPLTAALSPAAVARCPQQGCERRTRQRLAITLV